jgi:pyruvate dehydrogenase E1 component alpha subunit
MEEWRKRDPILLFETKYLATGLLTPATIQEVRSAVDRELDEAVTYSESSPSPQPEECLTDVYVE